MKRASCGLWVIERDLLHLERFLWFMTYRTRNIILKCACFGIWLIQRGTLHLKRATYGLWLTELGILYLKRASFGIWLIERGMLHLKYTCVKKRAYRTRNIAFEARLLLIMAHRTRRYNVAKCNLGKVKLQAYAVSGLLIKRT